MHGRCLSEVAAIDHVRFRSAQPVYGSEERGANVPCLLLEMLGNDGNERLGTGSSSVSRMALSRWSA